MTAIALWIALGWATGLLAYWALRVDFPGGALAAMGAGAFGAVVGALALVLVVAERAPAFDAATTVAAIVGAALSLGALIGARSAEAASLERRHRARRRPRR